MNSSAIHEIKNSDTLVRKPVVSVHMVAYNHAPYIKQAIEGVVAQKTEFSFELVIGEDYSTDGTRQIVLEYQKKYSNRIIVIISDKNVGAHNNSNRTLLSCRGKYIAFCEGDDYWSDPLKLQKQIDFLEKNSDFAICFHRVKISYVNEPSKKEISNQIQNEITNIKDLASGNYIHTASCVYRKNIVKLPDWVLECPVGDYPMHLLNAQYGKIKFFAEVMAVYRVHQGGVWGHKNVYYRLEKWATMLKIIKDKFDHEVNQILINSLYYVYFDIAILYLKDGNYHKSKIYLSKCKEIDSYRFPYLRIIILFVKSVIKSSNWLRRV